MIDIHKKEDILICSELSRLDRNLLMIMGLPKRKVAQMPFSPSTTTLANAPCGDRPVQVHRREETCFPRPHKRI